MEDKKDEYTPVSGLPTEMNPALLKMFSEGMGRLNQSKHKPYTRNQKSKAQRKVKRKAQRIARRINR